MAGSNPGPPLGKASHKSTTEKWRKRIMKKWYNVELKIGEAWNVVTFCKKRGIDVEASGIGDGYAHLEINCTEMEAARINYFIDTL